MKIYCVECNFREMTQIAPPENTPKGTVYYRCERCGIRVKIEE